MGGGSARRREEGRPRGNRPYNTGNSPAFVYFVLLVGGGLSLVVARAIPGNSLPSCTSSSRYVGAIPCGRPVPDQIPFSNALDRFFHLKTLPLAKLIMQSILAISWELPRYTRQTFQFGTDWCQKVKSHHSLQCTRHFVRCLLPNRASSHIYTVPCKAAAIFEPGFLQLCLLHQSIPTVKQLLEIVAKPEPSA